MPNRMAGVRADDPIETVTACDVCIGRHAVVYSGLPPELEKPAPLPKPPPPAPFCFDDGEDGG